MPRVLISDNLSPRAAEIFRDRGIDVDVKVGMDPDTLAQCIGDYDGLAVRSATKATADILAKATNMKVIGRAGIGVDNIDIDVATQQGVVVMNTPYGNATTTAEHAIGLMFALARQIPAADASTQAGKWEKSRFMGIELDSKTLGLIGCGNIGSIVADRAQGLKMRVIAHDPFLSPERAADLGVEKVELDVLFARSDFITLHTPLTVSTQNIIDADSIAKMRKGVRIVNCARGGLVDEEAVMSGLESGQIAGAAFDVFTTEPARESVLFGHPAVVCTPHLGAATTEAQEKVALQVAQQMSDFLLTGAVTNAINMASVTAEDAPRLQPYMELAENLGSFAGQLTETGIQSVSIEFEGHVATLNTRPLVSAALMGLLAPMLNSVNMVSAPAVARERNSSVTESKNEQPGDYETLIRVTVETEQQSRSITGTLFGGGKARIVNIKDIEIEAEFAPHMLYITNKDQPGVIGDLGRTLSDAGVNIASFHLGRAFVGGDAIALIQVDQPVTSTLLDAVAMLPNVVQTKSLAF